MTRNNPERSLDEKPPQAKLAFGLPRPSRRLAALTSSALALPGIAGNARADAPIERAEGSYAFSYYKEDDLRERKFDDDGSGSRERYEVYTHQLRFDFPVAERFDLGVSFLYEDMSGASPWFVTANGSNGNLVQAMSGATIEDERYDLTIDTDFYLENGKDNFAAGFSKERDYLSVHGGLGAERNFNDKNTTISASGAFSYDWIEPTDAGQFITRVTAEEKWSLDLFASFSQILARSTTGQLTINYKHSDGFLADPYKTVASLNPSEPQIADRRPGNKDQVSILGRIRHHIEPINSSIHFDYRFYADTFDVTSHTFELAWYQDFFDFLTITPSVRYYSQSKADFYEPILGVGVVPRDRSSDFRLSPYGSISTKLKVEARLVGMIETGTASSLERFGMSGGIDLFLAVSYERYLSDGAYALTTVDDFDEAPGLVEFQVFAATLTGRF